MLSMVLKPRRFKVFKIELRLNCDYVIINLIIILNINNYIKLVQILKY